MFVRAALIAPAFLLTACQTWSGGTSVILTHEEHVQYAQACKPWDDWAKPAPSFYVDDRQRNATAYVGSCGITVLAVWTDDGVVLFDTGEERFHEELLRNLSKFAVEPGLVTHILTSHEHFDHIGGLARMQQATGARIITSPAAKPVIESGIVSGDDPQSGTLDPMAPANVWKTVKDGETITLGGKEFTAIHTPGHTPGAISWQWSSYIGQEKVQIVYADSLSPVSADDYRFSDHPEYLAAYRAGIERLRGLDCDILLTPHPSHSKMVERAATGTFEGGMTCADYAASKSEALEKRLAQEAAQ